MKQQSGSKRLSTFARYVVSYMLVLLLALSALFLYMYVYMNREVRAQVISNGINRLSRIAYQHEGYLDNMPTPPSRSACPLTCSRSVTATSRGAPMS